MTERYDLRVTRGGHVRDYLPADFPREEVSRDPTVLQYWRRTPNGWEQIMEAAFVLLWEAQNPGQKWHSGYAP